MDRNVRGELNSHLALAFRRLTFRSLAIAIYAILLENVVHFFHLLRLDNHEEKELILDATTVESPFVCYNTAKCTH